MAGARAARPSHVDLVETIGVASARGSHEGALTMEPATHDIAVAWSKDGMDDMGLPEGPLTWVSTMCVTLIYACKQAHKDTMCCRVTFIT